MTRLPIPSAVLLFASAALVACASPVDDEGAAVREDEHRVRPTGTDVPGGLVVSAPAGAPRVAPTTVECLSKEVSLGEPITPLPVGTHIFGTETRGAAGFLQTTSRAAVASGSATTVTTGLLGVDAVKGPRTLGLRDLHSSTGIPFAAVGAGVSVNGSAGRAADGAELFPILEGEYDVLFGLNATDGVRVKIQAGETVKVELARTTDRRVTRVKAPVRELPTATCGNSDLWTVSLRQTSSARQDVSLADGEELDLGVSLLREGHAYTLLHSSWSEAHPVPLGERGQGPRTWQLGRLDVDDVSVNGGPPSVRGAYAVFPANADGAATGPNILRCKPPTNTGVDVPPGRYRLEIEFDTVASGKQKDVHVVDIP